jgi:hypothetical protein
MRSCHFFLWSGEVYVWQVHFILKILFLWIMFAHARAGQSPFTKELSYVITLKRPKANMNKNLCRRAYFVMHTFLVIIFINIFFLYVTLELIRKCGIIWFFIGHWNCSDSVALFDATLSEQFQSPIEKWKTNNASLSEQFQSPI